MMQNVRYFDLMLHKVEFIKFEGSLNIKDMWALLFLEIVQNKMMCGYRCNIVPKGSILRKVDKVRYSSIWYRPNVWIEFEYQM
jgi:hypothetical protein